MIRKRERNHQKHLKDPLDDTHHFKYDIKRAEDEFEYQHMRENDIDEEFARGAVTNPAYEIDGAVIENPAYLVSQSM